MRHEPPEYAAEVAGDLLVRRGSQSRVLQHVVSGDWLADGRYLVRIRERYKCPEGWFGPCRRYPAFALDLEDGTLTRAGAGLTDETAVLPVSTVWGLSWLQDPDQDMLRRSPPDLSRRVPALRLPPADGKAEFRSYGETVTIGDATFVEFSDILADHAEEYGYLRVVGDETEKVLLGQRIAKLWVSADGRSLLGEQQLQGDPCGGCIVSKQVVEVDPTTGDITAEYGVPKGYDRLWGVGAIDKVDGRVAVRYGQSFNDQVALWVHEDGAWSMVEGSEGVLTWWQGPEDRIELRPDPNGGRDRARLFWIHGGEETPLPGETASGWLDVPGSLLPPDE